MVNVMPLTSGEREIPGSIALLAVVIFNTPVRFVPVLTVDEIMDRMFYVNLGVEDVEAPEKWITALSDVLAKEEFASSRLPILKAFTDLSVIIPEGGTLYRAEGGEGAKIFIGRVRTASDEDYSRYQTIGSQSIPSKNRLRI